MPGNPRKKKVTNLMKPHFTEHPLVVVPLIPYRMEGHGIHLVVDARRGRHKLRMLIDSGASNTVVDLEKIRPEDAHPHDSLLQIQTAGAEGGRQNAPLVRMKGLKLGGLVLPAWDVAGMDFSGIRSAYRSHELKPVSGILGGDVLQYYRARIDYGLHQLELFKPHDAPPFG
jgi:hypothetical protein